MPIFEPREGEVELPFDPAKTASDGSVVFIGRMGTPWKTRAECPMNLAQAREQGLPATVYVDEVWRKGLIGLENFSHAIVLYPSHPIIW